MGDRRAYDLLVKLATIPEHALGKTVAIEALGRVGRSAKASRRHCSWLADPWLASGFSWPRQPCPACAWFDHPEGWQTIRGATDQPGWPQYPTHVELLGCQRTTPPRADRPLGRLLATDRGRERMSSRPLSESGHKLWGRDYRSKSTTRCRTTKHRKTTQLDPLFDRAAGLNAGDATAIAGDSAEG